jgi:type I restriction enzyme S subunit
VSTALVGDALDGSAVFTDGDWVESKDQDPNGDVRLVQLADIGLGQFLDKSSRYMTSSKASVLRCTYLEPGDLLVARMPDPIGRACIFPGDHKPCVTVVDVCIIRPEARTVDSRWLMHWFNSPAARGPIDRSATGTTRKRISRKNIEKLAIDLPPVEEQRRIAAILDAADALRAKRRQAIAKLDSLTQAIFIDMFGDPLTNPKGWAANHTLKDVADARSGITKGRKTGDAQLTTVPYLAVVNVQDGFIEMEPLKSIDATDKELERYRLVHGDILLTEGGDPDKLGRGAVWTAPVDPCIHQNHVFRVRVTDEKVTPEFLSRLLGSTRGKRYFLRMAKQTTGIASINMTQLRNFPILEPPLSLQKEYLSRTADVDQQRALVDRSATELDQLFASLQQRAFRGEL